LSLVRSTQALPQAVVLLEHRQLPDWQTLFTPQETGPETGFEHVPPVGSHVPATWQVSLAVHTTGFDPPQTPDLQVSVLVQAFPSLQPLPSAALGLEQAPVDELQVPTAWQTSLAEQTMGFDPVHVPDWHRSVCVQALPSSQVGLSVRGP
jgi:hypothetical protein